MSCRIHMIMGWAAMAPGQPGRNGHARAPARTQGTPCPAAGAQRREHRGNSAFLACTWEVRTMNSTYLMYEAERPRSTAEQREADARAGGFAAAFARLGRSLRHQSTGKPNARRDG